MTGERKILYLHGFGSSGASGTVDLLRREFYDADPARRVAVLAPDIPADPADALPMLKTLVQRELPNLIVGTSMGAMYAQQFRGFERICVNPSFEMSRLYTVVSVGRHKWLNKRRDGATDFQITKETIEHFRQMEEHQFDGLCEEDVLFCHGLFGTEDALTAGGREIFERHYPGMSQTFEGGHRLNADLVKHMLIPFIRRLGCV